MSERAVSARPRGRVTGGRFHGAQGRELTSVKHFFVAHANQRRSKRRVSSGFC